MSRKLAEHSLNRDALRYVESQSQICTLEFVDSVAEQNRLEELLEQSKPSVPEDLKGVHWLLRSSFRYPPLRHGSRFGTASDRGILYLSETLDALEAEMAFYAHVFYSGMLTPPPEPLRRALSVIELRVRTSRCLYADEARNSRQISDPMSWSASREFAGRARAQSAEVIRYRSARVSAGNHHNLAVLEPKPVQGIEPRIRERYDAITTEREVVLHRSWHAPRVFDCEGFPPFPG